MTSLEMKAVRFSPPSEGSMSNDIISVFQNTTRCPICLMKFNNPRRLYCDHSFCKSCLQGELDSQKQKDGNLTCVVCQEPVIISKGGVDQLDGMLLIHDITEFYQRSPQPKIQCSKCNGGYCSSCINLVCHRCDKYISTEFCTDCFEGFCARCAEEHEKTTGDHILVDVDQAHDIVKENSEDGEEEEKQMDTKMPVVIEEESQNNKEMPMLIEVEEERTKEDREVSSDNESDSGSELDFVYNVSGKSNEQVNEGDNNVEDMESTADIEDENGGLQLLSHTIANSDDSAEQNEIAEDHSADSSVNSSQGGFDYVYEVNPSADSNDEENASNDEDSPTSSQSGVVMTYEITQEGSQEEEEEGEEGEHEVQERREVTVTTKETTIVPPRDPPCDPPRDPPCDPPVHYYDNLQEIVNATVNASVSPEEVDRLRPSAPQNDKRRRVARIRPDLTHEPRIPESYYEIQSLKWCSRITIGFVLVLTLCTLALAGIAITAYIMTVQDVSTHIFQDYNVLVAQPQPFWIRSMRIVTSGTYDSTYYYETDLYLLECNDLVETEVNYTITKSGTQIDNARDIIIEIPTAPDDQFIYLAPSSIITFNVLIWSDYTYTGCTSELNVYNNYDDYLGNEGLQAVHATCIDIKRSSKDAATTFTYIVKEADFYFVTLSVQSEDSYSINITVDGMNYDTVINYDTKCTITSSVDTLEDQCDFQLLSSNVVWDINSYCILAETRPLISSSATSFVKFSISYGPNIFRNFVYIVIIVPLPLYFILCLLIWLCFKGWNVIYVKCRNMHFKHEYQVTEI